MTKKIDFSCGTQLTDEREVRLQRKHVQVVERCEGGVYSYFNDPAAQSHILSRPSGDKSAKKWPSLSNALLLPSMFLDPFARGTSNLGTQSYCAQRQARKDGRGPETSLIL